eukprot:5894487-Pyramimonas_sp.AAC.1
MDTTRLADCLDRRPGTDDVRGMNMSLETKSDDDGSGGPVVGTTSEMGLVNSDLPEETVNAAQFDDPESAR